MRSCSSRCCSRTISCLRAVTAGCSFGPEFSPDPKVSITRLLHRKPRRNGCDHILRNWGAVGLVTAFRVFQILTKSQYEKCKRPRARTLGVFYSVCPSDNDLPILLRSPHQFPEQTTSGLALPPPSWTIGKGSQRTDDLRGARCHARPRPDHDSLEELSESDNRHRENRPRENDQRAEQRKVLRGPPSLQPF